jgi:hypothetical protein
MFSRLSVESSLVRLEFCLALYAKRVGVIVTAGLICQWLPSGLPDDQLESVLLSKSSEKISPVDARAMIGEENQSDAAKESESARSATGSINAAKRTKRDTERTGTLLAFAFAAFFFATTFLAIFLG